MLLNNRIIWSDNGVLKDLSVDLSNFRSGDPVIDFKAAQDAIYLGSDMPFNHRYFKVSVANDTTSAPTVATWDGNAFTAAVDVLDQSVLVAGKTLSQSGIISWVTDRNAAWQREDTTENISVLSTLKIYNLYWAKLTFSADLKATFALSYVGHKFCEDDNLYAIYPDLGNSSLLDAFSTGKTNWIEQEVVASEIIVRDLRAKHALWTVNQILEWERFQEPCVHKTAELIFSSFGKDYEDDRNRARAYYKESLEQQRGGIDTNADARLDIEEKISVSRFRRR